MNREYKLGQYFRLNFLKFKRNYLGKAFYNWWFFYNHCFTKSSLIFFLNSCSLISNHLNMHCVNVQYILYTDYIIWIIHFSLKLSERYATVNLESSKIWLQIYCLIAYLCVFVIHPSGSKNNDSLNVPDFRGNWTFFPPTCI